MIVPPEINRDEPGRVLIVGRDPGENEVAEGRPFVGKAGEQLDLVLAQTGLRREDVNIANVVNVRPPGNDFKKHDESTVERGVHDIRTLARRLRPSLIITLGNEAAFAFVKDWPTAGRGIFGAKSIEERRGYFWESDYGWVLTTLHPAGVLRKLVPGGYLLEADFRRARRWLRGRLPRETFPPAQYTSEYRQIKHLARHRMVAFDIETKFGMNALRCIGFCGDDRIPYVVPDALFHSAAAPLLRDPKTTFVAHNGQFDLYALRQLEGVDVRLDHDSLLAWYALEPELAGRPDSGGEVLAKRGNGRMTRKGLAFLASLYFNVPWWKNYEDDWATMMELNARDVWVTREVIDTLLREIRDAQVEYQYRQAMRLVPVCLKLQERGIAVDGDLADQRKRRLDARAEKMEDNARRVGLEYITTNHISYFRTDRRCECCGGGKVARAHCWRCEGLPEKPTRKGDYLKSNRLDTLFRMSQRKITVGQLRGELPACTTCHGTGKRTEYHFNPFSTDQMKQLLYEELHTPRAIWKSKVTVDESALKGVLRWATGQK